MTHLKLSFLLIWNGGIDKTKRLQLVLIGYTIHVPRYTLGSRGGGSQEVVLVGVSSESPISLRSSDMLTGPVSLLQLDTSGFGQSI
jgi:hypothetical protein